MSNIYCIYASMSFIGWKGRKYQYFHRFELENVCHFLFMYHMINFVMFLAKVCFSMSIIGKIIQHHYTRGSQEPVIAHLVFNLTSEIFSASLLHLGILWDKNHIKIFCSEIWVEIIFEWPTFKIMCNTPIFYQLLDVKLKSRTPYWKGTIQGPSQPNLL
jgi:hypothetical protein